MFTILYMANVEFVRFKKVLKQNKHFITQPRMRLFNLLQDHPAMSAVEIIDKTPKHDRVTVYRNLALFEQLGIITTLRMGTKTKVELSDMFHHHHHHMTCTNCGKVIILKENSRIEAEISRIGYGTGFKTTDHQLEIRGLCKTCQ